MATNHEANVTLGGDASGAQAAAKGAAKEVDAFDKAVGRAKIGASKLSDSVRQSAGAWNVQAEAAKKAEQANYIAAARMENAKARAVELDRVFGQANKSSTLAANGITKVGAAAHHGRGPTQALGSAVHNLSTGSMGLSQATNMVLSSFGPWGMVIGAAVGALGHFIVEQMGAADASEKATLKIREEVAALKDLGKEARLQELNKAQSAALETNFFGAKTDEAEVAEQKAKAIRRELLRLEDAEARRKRVDAGEAGFRQDIERKDAERAARQEEELHEFDKQIAVAKSVKANAKDIHALELQRMRTQADFLQGEEKAKALREIELKELVGVNDQEGKRTKHKEKQLKLLKLITDAEMSATMAGPNFRGQVANVNEDAAFAAELDAARMGQAGELMRRSPKEDPRALAQQEATGRFNDSMRGIEAGAAANDGGMLGDFDSSPEVARIEQERVARQEFNDFMLEQQTTEMDRLAVLEERKQIDHESNLSRIEAEMEAEQAKKATLVGLAQQTVGALLGISDARRQATRLAKMQGATDKEAAKAGKIAALEQAAATLRSVRDMATVKALFEAGEAAAAFARYDIPSGIGHTVAAGLYGAVAIGTGIGANRLEKRADSMKSAGGFGGSAGAGAGGRGSGSSPRSGSANGDPNDSSIPGSPSPNAPSAANGPSGVANRRSVDLRGATIHLYGTPHEDFINSIEQGRRNFGYERRMKTGNDG